MFQVEYAGKAVDNGGLAVGVKCKDGVVGLRKLKSVDPLSLHCLPDRPLSTLSTLGPVYTPELYGFNP